MQDFSPVTILMVEDDAGHAVLIEKNLRRAGVHNRILHLDDGKKALDFLFQEPGPADNPHPAPYLVLLDLNLPVLDGCQVLSRIKSDRRTRNIPVIMLTTTENPHEISRCYDLGCNGYVTKPVEYEQFSEVVRNLGLLLSIVKIPNQC